MRSVWAARTASISSREEMVDGSRADIVEKELILSQFTGVARELKDALIVNPYNGEQTAEAIKTALELSPLEQTKRMKKLRETVRNYNIYRWSAELLKTIVNLV